MNDSSSTILDFNALDHGASIVASGGVSNLENFIPSSLGPLIEMVWLRRAGVAIPAITELRQTQRTKALTAALNDDGLVHISSKDGSAGFVKVSWNSGEDSQAFYDFRSKAQAGAERAGIPRTVAAQLIGALGELEDNIHVHSENPKSGFLGFSVSDGSFEFVIADTGIGVLRSLQKCPDFVQLVDHGDALYLAVREGKSRFGEGSGHGTGFHQLLIGLFNLKSALRFRSGNYALLIDGTKPSEGETELIQLVSSPGFITSVFCRP